jgi:hypothetical protein
LDDLAKRIARDAASGKLTPTQATMVRSVVAQIATALGCQR